MKKSRWCSEVKKLQAFSTRLESQKLLNVSNNKNNHKIWIDVKIIPNELLQVMIDSEAMNNYILHKAVQWLELISQQWWNSAQVYMANTSSMIVWDYVHMKMIVEDVSQKLTFDILNIKYDTILEMPWLHNRNSKIDWVNKKLCTTKHTYEISEQPEMYLSKHKSWDHEIPLLEGEQSKWMSLYSMSEDQLKKVWNYLDENLKREFIRPLKLLTGYLILFVLKKNDRKWLCVDYQQLNTITRQDSYPLSLIEELQDQLERVKYFTSLDLKDVYYWVRMKENKEWKMTFWTRYEHYKYIIMPFRLKNALTIFQWLINDTLREYLDDFVIVYLNDILIYSENLETHWEHMWKILKKLKERALYVKQLKSRFKTQKVKFLDYVIWSEQIEKNSEKTVAVQNWPTPTRLKKVQVFLKLVNYYWKFVLNYSQIVKPLTQLTQKTERWHWNQKQEEAFNALKESLSKTAHLVISQSACEKILKTDASDFVIDTCLYQIKDEVQRFIVFQSRKLSGLKKRYEVHDKELLAIVKALQEWRSYLAGTRKSIQIFTDHKNLRNFAMTKKLNWWQVCWTELLADFEFQIHYKKNNENGEVNTLSRWFNHEKVKWVHIKILSEKNEILTKELAATYRVKNTSLMNNELIQECHDSQTDKHLEVKRTENLIRQRHNISDLRNWVTKYITRCESCWKNKIQRDKQYDEVTWISVLSKPWKSITMNFIMKLSPSKNSAWEVWFNSILTIVNRLIKYTMFISFKKTATAPVLVYIILQELISNHRLSKEFIIDRDKLFTSKFWETLTAELRIRWKMLTAYHSQMNEQSEWMNQTVETYLRHYINKNQNNWVQLLSTAQFIYNNTRNETMSTTSFWVNYRYNSEIWWDSQTQESWSQKVILNIAEIKKLHQDLMKRLKEQKGKDTEFKSFWVEERVYLWTDNIQMKMKSKKLKNKNIESFKIVRDIKELSYELDLLKKMQIHSVFYAFMLQHCNQTISLQITETSVEFNEEYKIENILEKRMISEEAHYLIKWKGYDISENIWELRKNLKNCVRTLQCFEKKIELSFRMMVT